MKKFILGLLFVVFISPVFSQNPQDIIIMKDGTNIKAKVIEVSDFNIKYKKVDNINGPTYTIKKSEIIMIKYPNGDIDKFSNMENEKPNYSSLYESNGYQSNSSQNSKDKSSSNKKNENDGHNYIGSISAGYGTNHGGLGAKLLIGLGRGTGDGGFFLGVGTFNGMFFWDVGIQWDIVENLYMTFTYGDIGTHEEEITIYTGNNTNYSYSKEKIEGVSSTVGYRIKLDERRKFFLDLGVGYSSDFSYHSYLAFDVAFGMRF